MRHHRHPRAGTDDYNEATATFTVTVQAAGNLVLNVAAIAGDNTVNIAEKAAGFSIGGDTGAEAGVTVTVTVGTAELTATSADADPATWSVDVPADAAYITGTSVDVTVSAAKTGFTAPADVERTLTVDLVAPTAPTYTAPTALKLGVAITAMTPSGGSGIDGYEAEGLPSGLSIDAGTGDINGTPDTANASTATATVTVSDTAGNTTEVDIAFPAVSKGDQTLAGLQYSAESVTFGSAAPTVTAPTGALTTLSYSATPATVCTVDTASGALTLVGPGSCAITATAAGTDDYNEATATFTVTVQAAGNLVLNVAAIAGDNTVNIAEKAAGFSIGGDTGAEAGVTVTVTVGTAELTATSADADPATWSVDVPADAAYITGTSVDVTVSAAKTGFTAPADVERTLTVDLVAPTAPTYTAPTALKLGVAITAMTPSGGSGIDGYEAEGLPSGLSIDAGTGDINGTPDTANASTATATVTVSDTAGNTTEVDIAFPAVSKGDQTLAGLQYSAESVTFGSAAPTVTAPTGALTTLSYSATPATVCTVDTASGALTLVGPGSCAITATAAGTDDYNEATATFTVTVQAAGNLVLNVAAIAGDNTVNIAEKAAGFSIGGDTGAEAGVTVTVTVGTAELTATSADADPATWSVDVPADAAYITGTSVDVTVSAAKTGFTAPADVERTLTVDLVAPTAPTYTAPTALKLGVAITAMTPSGGSGIDGYEAEGLPSGLSIDAGTGDINGTPDTANASTATATVTVSDTAGNTTEVDIAFPAVSKGDQTLAGLQYSAESVTFGSAAPTVTAPTGALTTLSYSATPATVCTVDTASGALTLVGPGSCAITATAAGTDDYNEATATFTVTVQAAGNLVLNVAAIAGDNTVNIAEKAAGFSIGGDTGAEAGVTVTVTVGTAELTATSADADPATWSVDVPADAAYITGTSVDVTVSAAKTGFTAPADVERTLTVDLVAPTAPTYTAPTALKLGVAITAMTPSGGSGIDGYEAEGLPSGLSIDAGTGDINGTPDTANASTATATVTVSDTAGNTTEVDIAFPAVSKGDQTLAGLQYSAESVTFGSAAPTVTAPTGALTTLSYSATPATVCTVDTASGALTLVGPGSCAITATAAGTDDYNEATATFTVTVQAAGNLVLNVAAIAGDNTVNIAEKAAGFSIGGDTGAEAGVTVTVTVGTAELTATSADADPATWSVDVPADAAYITGTSVDVTVSAAKTGFTAPADVERTLTVDLVAPTAPTYTAPTALKLGVAITAMTPSGGSGIDGYEAEGLPSGLSIDAGTGDINGTPDTANASTATATVTVSDTAGNTTEVDIAFPAVSKGDQTLAGLQYSAESVTFGSAAPTVTAPTGALTTLSYSATPATVCTVDTASGALTLVGPGSCAITATAAGTDDYNEATATFTVTVQAAGNLVLNVAAIAGDNTVNIAEKAAGFSIGGDTGAEAGVTVTVTVGTAELTATSADADPATWSVDVPADAAYITGTSVDVTVSAAKTGFTAPADVERTLTVDLVAPTAPTYTAPTALKLGVAITAMTPSGGSGIDGYEAEGLPSGLSIDAGTGDINGTPDTANASTATATVTVSDTAGNTTEVDIAFPAVSKGDQTLAGLQYSAESVTFGSAAPTVTAPTGALTTLSYSATPATVCTVDTASGALTLVGPGSCAITATAAGTDDYNEATATFTVTVQAAGNLVLNVAAIAGDNTVNIAEKAAGFSIGGDTGAEAGVTVTVTVGTAELTATSADADPATWSVDVPADAAYITGTSVDVTVSAAKTGFTAPADVERTLTVDLVAPTAPTYTAPTALKLGVAITAMTPSGGSGIDGYEAEGLPSGLSIDAGTGDINGTPDTANASTATATVTVSDTAGNTTEVDIAFPAVSKGDQTLSELAYGIPPLLKVGSMIADISPTGVSGINSFRAAGLPAGLFIDPSTGVISGAPARANARTAQATVTVSNAGGNTAAVSLTFPAVAKGDQTLTGFRYSASSAILGNVAPTPTAPDGAQTPIRYTAEPSTVCKVRRTTGVLTLESAGSCVITATARSSANYEEATASTKVTVRLVSREVTLATMPAMVPENGGAATITVTGTLDGAPRTFDTDISVSVGAEGDPAVKGEDFTEVKDVTLTIPGGQLVGKTTFTLIPTDNRVDEADEPLAVSGATDEARLEVNGTSVTITDDDDRGVALSTTALAVPEGRRSTYTVALESQPTGPVTVTPSLNGDARATVSGALTFTPENWNVAQPVTVSAPADADTQDGAATVDHTVSGADYAFEEAASVAVTVTDSGSPSSAILLSVDTGSIAEDAEAMEVTIAAQLNRAALEADTTVTIMVGAAGDTSVEGADYAEVGDLALTIPAGGTSAAATFTLAPVDDARAEPDEAISIRGTAGTPDLDVIGTAMRIRDNDASNNAPVFSPTLPATLEVAENTPAEAAIGAPLAASDVDGHMLAYTLGGIGSDRFTIDRSSGQLSTRQPLNHETRSRYSLTVTADDGHGGLAAFALTVKVTDISEQPGTPRAPTVLAAPGTTTSLEVRWTAPERNGGPPVLGYTLEYRERVAGEWRDHRHRGADTRATVEGLTSDTNYEVRVRALNGETPGEWSETAEGSTGRQENTAPAFVTGPPTSLTVDENTAAGTELGAPFAATDSDDDPLVYLLEGADRQAFAIDPESGRLTTRAPLDHESQASYSLTIHADDSHGGADSIAVTVRVADIDEQAGTPAAPAVLAAAGSTTSLEVNWSAPQANGSPAVVGYAVQYRAAGKGGTGDAADAESANNEIVWIDHAHRGAATRAVIPYLDSTTLYQVRVRALNGEIAGEWSEHGSGRTGEPVNAPPAFGIDLPGEISVQENTPAGIDIGMPFTAADADGDTLTYLLDGAFKSNFAIDSGSGQLRTRKPLDHESKGVWPVLIRTSDGRSGADTIRVKVRVEDVDEPAPPLPAPLVLATPGAITSLDLHWSTPAPNGGPTITGYELQYRADADDAWIGHPHEGAEPRASIADLEPATGYQVRVRALNGEIPGDWSEPGQGGTGLATNNPPAFDAGLPAMLTVAENTPADTDLGAPFAATDSDGDRLTYLLDGVDRHAFAIEPDSGQLRTRVPLDYEAQAAYTLSVQVNDGAGGADTLAVTVNVADRDEAPGRPAAPWVLSSVEAATDLEVRWSAPGANGGPAITGYEVQYRAGAGGDWINHTHEGTAMRASIANLEADSAYQARVRALNGEAPGAWSEPGGGNTARPGNTAPAFADETATRSVREDSEAGDPIGAPVTAVDIDRDRLTYFLAGADADAFAIDPLTGQIRTRAPLDYEAQPTHSVTVTANDGNGGEDSIDVTIELIDAQEVQAVLGPAAPTGVTLDRTVSLGAGNVLEAEVSLGWDTLLSDAISWFEFRLGRYPESSNGMAPGAFECAGNRPFETDGWRRIPDSGPEGVNARSYHFDARALGCHVLPDSFELRAQVRAVSIAEDGSSLASSPSTEARMKDEAPRVVGIRLDATDLSGIETGDDLVFSIAFTEPVRVTQAADSPTLAIELGGDTRQAVFAAATEPPRFRDYGAGPIGSRLQFRYPVQEGDDLTAGIVVPARAISLSGGAAIVDATGPGGHAADLRHPATTIAEGTRVVATSAQAALQASIETDSVPHGHDGATPFTVQVRFNEAKGTNAAADDDASAAADGADEGGEPATESSPELPGLTLSEASFLVTGGRITELARLTPGENHLWTVRIEPEARGDVSISLGPTSDCAGEGAVCTDDGLRLTNNVHAVVKGPPGLSVVDARAAEAPGATMDFLVTLNRALPEAVSINYATFDGTAMAGTDYTPLAGTLIFAAGETVKTVAVPVLDDAHDDDGETFTLTLSNPLGSHVYLLDHTATGIIENSDPMPKAWIARFGRTVSDHVIEAIQARFHAGPQESQRTIGGLRLGGALERWFSGVAPDREGAGRRDDAIAERVRTPENLSYGDRFGGLPPPAYPSSDPEDRGGGTRPGARTADQGSGLPSLKELLMGSSFFWTSANGDDVSPLADGNAARRWSAWGRMAATQFRGQDGPLSIDGEVSTAMLGVDAGWNRWMAGIVLARSEGEGGYAHRTASGGAVTSTLTSLHPFAQYRFNEQTSVWGTFGYGVGDLSLTPTGASVSVDTDLRTAMAVLGGRGVLSVRTGAAGAFELAVRSDAMLTQTESGAKENLLAATGATGRVRVLLEGAGSIRLGTHGVLAPTLEAGLRYDGGDAETGAGLEIGGGLSYTRGRLIAQMNARLLAAHEDAAYEEWGFSGSIGWKAASDGRGLSLDLGSIWGAAQSGVQSLWTRPTAGGLVPGAPMDASQRYRAELGFGLEGPRGRALWVPFLGAESSANGSSSVRMGVRLTSGANAEARLEIDRVDSLRDAPGYGFNLAGRIRW